MFYVGHYLHFVLTDDFRGFHPFSIRGGRCHRGIGDGWCYYVINEEVVNKFGYIVQPNVDKCFSIWLSFLLF